MEVPGNYQEMRLVRLVPRTGAGLKLGAGVAIMKALPLGRAKQEPFKASHVGASLKQRLDIERDWLQMRHDGLR